ncbi:MAG TPA: tetratricopeptide repeat protein, partial [Deinococcales bacterium]|nr:tetratricopeptide repeat protein [Deinococcales bacterium]
MNEQLERMRSGGAALACAAARSGLGGVPARPAGGSDLDEQIRALQAEIARLDAGDPRRPALVEALEKLKALKAEAERRGGDVPAVATPGLAVALQVVERTLEQELGTAYRQFLSSPAARDARLAQEAAAAAIAERKPAAAAAALVAAYRAQPRNAALLVNAAGVLGLLGMNAEALVFLDAADALATPLPGAAGVPGRALALNNRGFVLVRLGRYQEAEQALREA